MKNAKKIFREFLAKKDLKLTGQRMLLLNIFMNAGGHLSVDDLYSIARKKDRTIGHTTVFRTLKLFCEAGIAKKVHLKEERTHFETQIGTRHHDHLICTKCGNIIEAMDPKIEALQIKLCKKFNFSPDIHRLEIFGTCEKCG